MDVEEYHGVVAKIYDMINDPTTDSIISWNQNRTSFIVWDQQKLTEDVLPKVFGYTFFPRIVGYDCFHYFIDMLSRGYGIHRISDSVHKFEFSTENAHKMSNKIYDMRVKLRMMVICKMMKKKNSGNEADTFVGDVYDMVDESCTDSVITWTKSGKSFIILDPQEFSKVVLPRFLLFDNFERFTRMLRRHGFKKDWKLWEFAMKGFVRGNKDEVVKEVSRLKKRERLIMKMKRQIMKRKQQMNEIAAETLKQHIDALHI